MGKQIKVGALASILLMAGLVSGCTQTPADSPPTAPSVSIPPMQLPDADGDAKGATEAAFRKWGLKPLAAPPAPPKPKPVTLGTGDDIPVISEIPTRDKVVFITVDDGAEKDPEFVTMMRELKIPFTMFLTDSAISSDYDYFKRLQQLGNGVHSHTLTHPNLRTLGAAAQKQEICGQQEKLRARYGTTPRLFRPPYGNWNEDTRAVAGSCGVEAIVLWRESMQITNMQYQRADKRLHPGDIILAHFRGPSDLKGKTMTEMTANLLRHIQEQGFTVARLEHYM